MIATTANCPSCGAPITFKIGSSIVVICEFCNSAIARTDRELKNLGKVADLLDTRSPLSVGTEGRFEGKAFVLTGRAQLAHSAGGVWDEWYAAFGDGRWGWLAEAQGRFYMTFPRQVTGQMLVPPFDALNPGEPVVVPGSPNRYVVAETGFATTVSAEGEIPYALVPGERYPYADLSGDAGAFATIDYSEAPPLVFHGNEVTLAELKIFGQADEFSAKQRRVGVVRLICPRCNGPLELRAPDASLRVTCPNCNSLLDVNQGNLTYLTTLAAGPSPLIPLGAEGVLPEGKLTLAGFMRRSCVVEGTRYWWEEYLLYNPQIGFRWLVRSDDHWTYVRPLAAGAVFDGGKTVSYRSRAYREFQRVTAFVDSVFGEFYWRVEVGEATQAADYVNPPEMISKEVSGSEINWSLGSYITPREVENAFKLEQKLPAPKGVGAPQPNPHPSVLKTWGTLLFAAIVVGLALFVIADRRTVLSRQFIFPPLENSTGSQVAFSDPVTLRGQGNIRVTARAPVNNGWVFLEGDLVNDETGLVQNFSLPIEYYQGIADGESWSEGSTESEVFLSSLPAGQYTIRLEAQWGNDAVQDVAWRRAMPVQVDVQQDVPRIFYLLILLGLLSIPALIGFLIRRSFEQRRWSNSMFNPYESE
jgi:hypothetical protein